MSAEYEVRVGWGDDRGMQGRNLWSVRVFGRIDGFDHIRPITWSRGDLGDPVHELMTQDQALVSAGVVVARAVADGGEVTLVQVTPTFTSDGNWCWSGERLTVGSIAHQAWLRSVGEVA